MSGGVAVSGSTAAVGDGVTAVERRGRVAFTREGGDFVLRAAQWLPAARERVWRFVADCRHMNEVIPGFMRFEVLSPMPGGRPPAIGPGVIYEYRLHLHGIGVFWRTRITEVAYPERFVDVQAKGPYKRFAHEHGFEERAGGTMTTDTLRYRPPGGPLAGLVHAAMVKRDLRRLFEHRHARLAELFADGGDPAAGLRGDPIGGGA
ncbi:MAG: SRPBCC family protein [Planctomycetota bacterium]